MMGISGQVVSQTRPETISVTNWCFSTANLASELTVIGGVTNGQEMVAAYLREKFPGPVSNSVIAMADVGTKGIDYEHHSMFETVWWLWQIVKASTMGKSKWKRT